jgi:hypothetical protein
MEYKIFIYRQFNSQTWQNPVIVHQVLPVTEWLKTSTTSILDATSFLLHQWAIADLVFKASVVTLITLLLSPTYIIFRKYKCRHILVLDTSVFAKDNMDRREYKISQLSLRSIISLYHKFIGGFNSYGHFIRTREAFFEF